jgi:hypothetical protein
MLIPLASVATVLCGLLVVSEQLSTPAVYGGACGQRAGRAEEVLSECHDMELPRF